MPSQSRIRARNGRLTVVDPVGKAAVHSPQCEISLRAGNVNSLRCERMTGMRLQGDLVVKIKAEKLYIWSYLTKSMCPLSDGAISAIRKN